MQYMLHVCMQLTAHCTSPPIHAHHPPSHCRFGWGTRTYTVGGATPNSCEGADEEGQILVPYIASYYFYPCLPEPVPSGGTWSRWATSITLLGSAVFTAIAVLV
jgi:hypothetical protein